MGCNNDEKSQFAEDHYPLLKVPGPFSLATSSSSPQETLLNWSESRNAATYTITYYTSIDPTLITIDKVSSPYQLLLSSGRTYYVTVKAINQIGTTSSNEITISPSSPVPTHLHFSILPSTTGDTDSILLQQPTIEIRDANNVVVSENRKITIHSYSDSSCSTELTSSLDGNSMNSSSGISTFIKLKILKTNVKAIKAKSDSLESMCLSGIVISAGSIDSLAFTTIPSPLTIDAGTSFSTQPTVTAYDANSNIVTNNSISTVVLETFDTINCSGTLLSSSLGGTTSISLLQGVATFTDIVPNNTLSKSIRASLGPLSACLSPISVTPTVASKLKFTNLPSTTGDSDTPLTKQPVIAALDENDLKVSSFTGTITIHGYSDSTCSTEVTSSTSGNSIAAFEGTSTFSALKILKTNVVALKAKSGAITSDCINGLSISPGAISSIAFTTNPAPSTLNEGSVFTTQPVLKAYDANSNLVTTDTTSIVALNGYDTINCTGAVISSSLKGTTSASLTNGVVTFTDVGVLITSTKSIMATLGTAKACFSPLTVNPVNPSAAFSSIALSSGTANNSSSITVTITLKDDNQNPVVGVTPDYKLLNSKGNYTVVSPCSPTNASGVSTCSFRTWRGKERIVQITSPAGLTGLMAKSNLTCGSYFAGNEGNGTSANPYLVSTIIQLDQLRCGSTNYYRLMNNFDLSGYDWVPNYYTTSIDIDGNNKTISNLSIIMDFSDYSKVNSYHGVATFLEPNGGGYYGSYQTVKDLTFLNPVVIANGAIGTTRGTSAAVVCSACGYKFENIHVLNGQVGASDTVAGLILTLRTYEKTIAPYYSEPTELINSSFSGTIFYTPTSTSVARYRWGIGGLVNVVTGGGANIKNNIFSGTIDGTQADAYGTTNIVGGIVARVDYDSDFTLNDLSISNNQVINSSVITKSSAVGGIIGRHVVYVGGRNMIIENNVVKDSHFTINSPNNIAAQLGGLTGIVLPSVAPTPCNYSSKEITIRRNAVSNISLEATNSDAPKIGGLFGQLAIANVENNYINNSSFTFLPANNSNKRIGGLVGAYSDTTASCTNITTRLKSNYAAITLSPWNASNTFIMGLVGRKINNVPLTIDLTSDDNYFDSQTSGLAEAAPYNDNGVNTATMTSGIPFSGWSTTIWDFQNGAYPTLK